MSFSRQAPRERAVRAQVAAPSRSASHDKEAALTDAERFFSAPRFSVSDEADGSESRTPLASTDGNRMATKPAGASLASGKRLASLQQALTRAMSAVKAQDLTLEEAERDRDRYAESLSIATDRAAAAEKKKSVPAPNGASPANALEQRPARPRRQRGGSNAEAAA